MQSGNVFLRQLLTLTLSFALGWALGTLDLHAGRSKDSVH